MTDLIKRLDEYIEYATKTKRFADVGFYEKLKSELEAQEKYIQVLEALHKEAILG